MGQPSLADETRAQWWVVVFEVPLLYGDWEAWYMLFVCMMSRVNAPGVGVDHDNNDMH